METSEIIIEREKLKRKKTRYILSIIYMIPFLICIIIGLNLKLDFSIYDEFLGSSDSIVNSIKTALWFSLFVIILIILLFVFLLIKAKKRIKELEKYYPPYIVKKSKLVNLMRDEISKNGKVKVVISIEYNLHTINCYLDSNNNFISSTVDNSNPIEFNELLTSSIGDVILSEPGEITVVSINDCNSRNYFCK